MDQSLARREALRIFRVVLVVQLVFVALGSLAIWGLAGSAQFGLFLRLAPTLLLALLVLPPWLERVMGRYFLALAVGLDVLLVSLQSAHFFYEQRAFWAFRLGLPEILARHLAETPPVEPFFFLLIPLVLLAWGYGRRGALWGSTWAALLYDRNEEEIREKLGGATRWIKTQAIGAWAFLFRVVKVQVARLLDTVQGR